MDEKYQSIINMQNPTSLKHPRMSRLQRAAQFAPFAALTGHDEKIKETARLTDKLIELDEEQLVILNQKLQIINEFKHLEEPVKFIYFVKDLKLVPAPLLIAIILEIFIGLGTGVLIPLCSIISILVAYLLFRNEMKKKIK